MNIKINILSKTFLLSSICIGVILSVLISTAIYRQAEKNLDPKAAVRSVLTQIDVQIQSQSHEPTAVGGELSEYNRKVANSMLLGKMPQIQDVSISDPYLNGLKGEHSRYMNKNFAIKEYGVVIVAFVGLLSTVLTSSIAWLVMSIPVYIVMKQH